MVRYWAFNSHDYEDGRVNVETEDFNEARHAVWQAVVNGSISSGQVVVLNEMGTPTDNVQYSCYRDSQGILRES